MLTHPSFSPHVRRALLASLVALVAFLAWDRTRRPALHGPRFFHAAPGETDAGWCLKRCQAIAGVRCYDEEEICRRAMPGASACTIAQLQSQPWLVWRYQCFAASLSPSAGAGQETPRVPQACLMQCF